ncbi:MAG: AAA family ATPase [Thermodesulfovibrio sp.]|nr:AAA family ATPase [Thermodesulfovibrio sp.]
MSSFNHDSPITGASDSPDLLNRESFAERLAAIVALKEGQDCLTISLEGEWGYGKTSLINLINKYLKAKEDNPIIVEFNPWLAGSSEVLVQDFLVHFSAQLDISDRPEETKSAAKQLLSYSKLFTVLKLIPGAEPWATILKEVISAVGTASEEIGKLKELNLLKKKNLVREALLSLGKPIVVIIDDIDRLTPEEAFQVIRLVKAVADFPRTTFILAFDPEYLSSALEKGNIAKGSLYLDKVIQLRVPLPVIGKADMHKLAMQELASLADHNLTDRYVEDQDRLASLYWQYSRDLIRNPRELRRIFNHLRLTIKETYGEVCFADIYGLSILAIKAPEVYALIKDEPAAFVGRGFSTIVEMTEPKEIVKKYEDKRKTAIDKCPERDRYLVGKILEELFPLTVEEKFAFGSTEYDRNGRVASPDRLYVALHYRVPTDYFSEKEVISLIGGKIDRKAILQNAITNDSIERLFDLLRYNSKNISEEQRLPLLRDFYNVLLSSDYLKEKETAAFGFFQFEPFRSLIWLTEDIVGKANDKTGIVMSLCEKEEYLPISGTIMRTLLEQYGEIKEGEAKPVEQRWVNDGDYLRTKEIWTQVAVRAFDAGNLSDSVFASKVFFMLKRVNQDATKKLFEGLLQKVAGVEIAAKIIGRTGSDSAGGPYSSIKKEDLANILDYDVLKDRANSELESGKELTPYIKAVYKSIVTGNKYYLKDASEGKDF